MSKIMVFAGTFCVLTASLLSFFSADIQYHNPAILGYILITIGIISSFISWLINYGIRTRDPELH